MTTPLVPSDAWPTASSLRAIIIGDAAGHAAHALEIAGVAVLARVPVADGAVAIADYAGADLVFVELGADADMPDALLALIDAAPANRGQAAIVAFPLALLDAVAASIGSHRVTLLCAPDLIDCVAALGIATIGADLEARKVFHDSALDGTSSRIQRLADEVARIAATLAALADAEAPGPGGEAFSDGLIGYRAPEGSAALALPRVSAAFVRNLIRQRRARDRFFPADLFADPAWDILLDLMAARIERRRVAVSSLCIASAVPPTTALRTIAAMTARGLLVRRADDSDRRRVFVELSDSAAEAMMRYFAAAAAP